MTLEIEVDPAAFNARRSAPIDVADDCACVCVCVLDTCAAAHPVVLIPTFASSAVQLLLCSDAALCPK